MACWMEDTPMKKFLFSLAAGLMLLLPMAAPKADAQVVVRVGPRYHHHYYHHAYYRHHYYHHHYYRHYYR
jgi:hypothetical protein